MFGQDGLDMHGDLDNTQVFYILIRNQINIFYFKKVDCIIGYT